MSIAQPEFVRCSVSLRKIVTDVVSGLSVTKHTDRLAIASITVEHSEKTRKHYLLMEFVLWYMGR